MVSYTEQMMDSWREGDTRDAHQDIMRLTLEILTNTLFNTDVARDAEEVGPALEIVMERFAPEGSLIRMLDNYLPTLGWIRFQKTVRRLDEIIYRMIAKRRNTNEDRSDLPSMLLASIAQRFRLVIAPNHTVTVWPSLTLRPKHGMG